MGYRSEVKSLIYGTPEEMKIFKESVFDLYNQVREDFDTDLTDHNNGKYEILYLNLSYMKWYDEYEEVQRWDELYQLADNFGLATEFCRAGEEQGDVEVYNSGHDGSRCEFYLEVIQRIEAHFDR
jgi:hypothetical protein